MLIGLIGYPLSGKSTIARHLEINHNYTRIVTVDYVLGGWTGHLDYSANVVLEDCHRIGDVKLVKKHGGEIWRIMREGTHVPHHWPLDSIKPDRTIHNNNTIGNLKSTVDNLVLSPTVK